MILTPMAANTSALPDREETERFPCLATVMPPPATTNAVAVEIIKGIGSIATGSAGVHDLGISHVDTHGHFTHGFDRPRDFFDGLALHTKAHEVCGDLGFGRGTIHDLKHDVIGFFFREVDTVNQFCEGVFDHAVFPLFSHRFPSLRLYPSWPPLTKGRERRWQFSSIPLLCKGREHQSFRLDSPPL